MDIWKRLKKRQKEKLWILIRLIIVFVIPVCITLILIPERIELTYEKISENVTNVSIEEKIESVANETHWKSSIVKILKIPLVDIEYEVCFVNKGTKLIHADGTEDTNVIVSLNFDNQTEFNISYNQTRCVPYPNRDFTYRWRFLYRVNLSKVYETESVIIPWNETMYWERRKFTFSRDTDSYGKVKPWSSIPLIILVFISWWGFVWLFTRILKFINFGWKQS